MLYNMSDVRFIGCLHLGHEALAKYRGFSDSWEHDEYLIRAWNSVVKKRDVTYILGDVTFETSEHYYKLDQLNGRKKVILGNHDRAKDIPELLQHVDSVAGLLMYKGFMLSHAPIHPAEISFCRGNIHAHIHHLNKIPECMVVPRYGDLGDKEESTANKYISVDAKLIGFKPISLEEILTLRDL